jgi:cysteine synthase
MSVDKRSALATAGADVVLAPNKPLADPENFRQVARRLAADHGWLLADQFANPANPAIHEATTGPEILDQAGGRVGALVAGAGTGGTITGVGRFLRRACPSARVVLADPVGSVLADYVEGREGGAEGPYAVEGIGTSVPPPVLDRRVVDAAERIPDEESFAMTGRLIKEEGLLVGASAGTAVVAAVRVAAAGDIEGPVVVILPDAWDRYRSTPWMAALAGVPGAAFPT